MAAPKLGLPAEHYARLYLKQPWGGSAAMAHRHLLAEIREELNSPERRCPACEEPGYPVLMAWPERSKERSDTLRRRYLLCVLCGHKTLLWHYRKAKPGPKPIFTPEQEEWICTMYENGFTSRQIAKQLFCHPGTVRNTLRRHGRSVRSRGGSLPLRRTSHKELELIRFLYEYEGLTQAQIAARLGTTIHIISARVRWGGMVRFGRIPKRKRAA